MPAIEGTILDGKYRVLRCLGEGGMGVVYEAEHAKVRRRVAVKLLARDLADDPAAVERFQREAEAAGRIGHDNICEVLDSGTAPDGAPFLVMPLLRGVPLAEVVRAEAPLPVPRACDIASQVLAAIRSGSAASADGVATVQAAVPTLPAERVSPAVRDGQGAARSGEPAAGGTAGRPCAALVAVVAGLAVAAVVAALLVARQGAAPAPERGPAAGANGVPAPGIVTRRAGAADAAPGPVVARGPDGRAGATPTAPSLPPPARGGVDGSANDHTGPPDAGLADLGPRVRLLIDGAPAGASITVDGRRQGSPSGIRPPPWNRERASSPPGGCNITRLLRHAGSRSQPRGRS